MKRVQHEIYRRRGTKNIFVGVMMGLFVVLVFLVTLVKLTSGNMMQGFDHALRPELVERQNLDE